MPFYFSQLTYQVGVRYRLLKDGIPQLVYVAVSIVLNSLFSEWAPKHWAFIPYQDVYTNILPQNMKWPYYYPYMMNKLRPREVKKKNDPNLYLHFNRSYCKSHGLNHFAILPVALILFPLLIDFGVGEIWVQTLPPQLTRWSLLPPL